MTTFDTESYRRCRKCAVVKLATDDHFVSQRGLLLHICVECRNKDRRQNHLSSHSDRLRTRRIYTERQREHLRELGRTARQERYDYIASKKTNPCTDCGVSYPAYVMDFDHVRGDKVSGLAKMAGTKAPYETIDAEIAKCDLVCSNCHRIRTHCRDH